jgi:glyoxylase-like metal-dependent hydrolase (beta-lactamase superfamily II)
MKRRLFSLLPLLVVCLAAAALFAQQAPGPDPLVKENGTVKVGPHTYAIPDDNTPVVPNVGIVVGSRATLVIDPGAGRVNGERVLREVAKVSKHTEVYVAATHWHTEHTTGAIAFPASAKFIANKIQVGEMADGMTQQVANFSKRSPATAEILKGATAPTAAITFENTYSLDLGGVTVNFIGVGPTHTRGDTAFHVVQDGVLFSGDVVMNNSFLAAQAPSSMKAWLAAFDTLGALKPKVIVPAHGAIGDGSLIAANRAVMQAIQARALELKKQGRPVEEVGATVQKEMEAKHPGWPRAGGVATAARSAYNEAP